MKNKIVILGVLAIMVCMIAIIITVTKKTDNNEFDTENPTEIVFTPYEGFAYDTIFADTKYPVTPFQRIDGRMEFRVADGEKSVWSLEISEGLEVDYDLGPSISEDDSRFAVTPKEDAKEDTFHIAIVDKLAGIQNEWDLKRDKKSGNLIVENPQSKEIEVDLTVIDGYSENKDVIDKVGVTTGQVHAVGTMQLGYSDVSVDVTSINYQFGETTRSVLVSDKITFEQLKAAVTCQLDETVDYHMEERTVKGVKVEFYQAFGTSFCIWEKSPFVCCYYHSGDDDLDATAKEIEDFIN